ncbi:hypothetical protein BGX31_002167 [Mortierella sp. GBA43]|nr:hypothetical protein BGX31_002167 [Mortierella sp. GBA43]
MAQKSVVVTGTAGIGKSAFLIYFTIRLLATSSDDSPPIREGSGCYAYGGLTTIRSGDVKDFEPFLNLAETWYIVDSSPEPQITDARTIISASPKALYFDMGPYQEVDKDLIWHYHMAPWKEEELKQCRSIVEQFNVVSEEFMSELYLLVGGVPRSVLQTPSLVLSGDRPSDDPSSDDPSSDDTSSDDSSSGAPSCDDRSSNDPYSRAKSAAYRCVRRAIDNIKEPLVLMQYFAQGKDSLEFSSHVLHRWPSDDQHADFHLEWASAHVAEEVRKLLEDTSWQEILKRLVTDCAGVKSDRRRKEKRGRIVERAGTDKGMLLLQTEGYGTI